MAREHSTGDIPEDRALSDDERALVGWMLEHGESNATSFLPQLEQASVSSRCASVNFSVGGKESSVTGMGYPFRLRLGRRRRTQVRRIRFCARRFARRP